MEAVPAKEQLRQPIVWSGRAKEPTPEPVKAATADASRAAPENASKEAQQRPAQRLKPNMAFLLNVVADAERGNQRRCAEDATAVSLSVLEKVPSFSLQKCPAHERMHVITIQALSVTCDNHSMAFTHHLICRVSSCWT
jgi:hypothetical protein